MSNYIKKYNVGNIAVDLPYNSYIHELPLLSFNDFRNAVNISLVFNYKLKIDGNNMFNIKEGFKLNIQKKIITNNGLPVKLIDANGKSVDLVRNKNSLDENSTNYNNLYTFNDESKRVLRVLDSTNGGYEIEYEDLSKEVFNSSGNIITTYDKYGDLYLSYTYNGDLLTSLAYNGKTVNFVYSNNTLDSIKYGETTTSFTYETNAINLLHYSNVSYKITLSNASYLVVGSGTEDGETVSVSKECLYQNNDIILNNKIGQTVVDTITYTFPEIVTDGYYSYDVITITNKKGVVQRLQYEDEKLLYSYELKKEEGSDNADAEFLVNETNDAYSQYINDVNINSIINESDFSPFIGQMKYGTGIQLSKTSISENQFSYDASLLNLDNTIICLVTGWVKSSTNNKNITMNVSNYTSGPVYQFPVKTKEANKWYFFAYQFTLPNGNFIYVNSSDTNIEFRDIKISFRAKQILDEKHVLRFPFKEDILIRNSTFDIFKLSDTEFQYTLNNGESGLVNLTFSDLLRYMRKTVFDNSSDVKVLYYENGKKVIDDVQSLKVKIPETNQLINVDSFSLGYMYSKDNIDYFCEIIKVVDEEIVFIVHNYKDGIKESTEKFNEFFDLIDSTKDNKTIHFVRDKGLVLEETDQALYSITHNYDETNNKLVITKTDINGSDEISTCKKYYIDSVWGAVYREEYGNNMECDNYYDSDKSTILSHVFNENYFLITHSYGYEKGNLSSLSCWSLNYNFEYNNGDLTKVLKCNNQIEEQAHTDFSSTVYYPSSTSPVYTKMYNYDKYGRLTSVEGELVNTYDVISSFDLDTGEPILRSSNSSSKLIMIEDKLKSLESRYSYNDKDLIQKIETTSSSNYANKVSEETFVYDDLNRLTEKEFIYNKSTGDKVKDEISYVKNVNDVNVDERINTNTYKINNQTISTTSNGYDNNKRLNTKTYTFNGGITATKEYGIQYNKINSETLKVNNVLKNTNTYSYDTFDRISSITNNNKTTSYEYDIYGRLVRENNKELDKTIIYTYNNIGNILNVKKYNYSTDTNPSGTPTEKVFTYDTTQIDKLVSVNNTSIPYNSIGCPTQYNGFNLTWSKGKLTGLSKGSLQTELHRYTYSYNAKGQRVSKNYFIRQGTGGISSVIYGMVTDYNKTYNYDSLGRLINEIGTTTYYQVGTRSHKIEYIYDCNTIIGIRYTNNGSTNTYYFDRNILGDVVGIYDSTGVLKAKYIYDAYGNCTISSETTDTSLARVNPIRYRGYYYDEETGWFWLSSRYYSPELCRFISPDDIEYLDPDSVNGLNLYCYCYNDPINYCDHSGNMAVTTIVLLLCIGAGALFGGAYAGVTAYNDGARGWELVGWIALGAVAGGAVGGIVGYYAGPLAASLLTSGGGLSLAGVEAAGLTMSGAMAANIVVGGSLVASAAGALAASSLLMFAKGNGPRIGHNQYENKQINYLCNKYNLTKDQRKILHRYISGQNYSFQEIEQIIIELFFS